MKVWKRGADMMRHPILCYSAVIILVLSGYAHAANLYRIKSGETLTGILAHEMHFPIYGPEGFLQQLLKNNQSIKNPDFIRPGQEILLPPYEPAVQVTELTEQVFEPDPQTNGEETGSAQSSLPHEDRGYKMSLGLGAPFLNNTQSGNQTLDLAFSSFELPSLMMSFGSDWEDALGFRYRYFSAPVKVESEDLELLSPQYQWQSHHLEAHYLLSGQDVGDGRWFIHGGIKSQILPTVIPLSVDQAKLGRLELINAYAAISYQLDIGSDIFMATKLGLQKPLSQLAKNSDVQLSSTWVADLALEFESMIDENFYWVLSTELHYYLSDYSMTQIALDARDEGSVSVLFFHPQAHIGYKF